MKSYGGYTYFVQASLSGILYKGSRSSSLISLFTTLVNPGRGYGSFSSASSFHSLLRACRYPLNELSVSPSGFLVGAGLQLQLPPFYTWPTQTDLLCDQIELYLNCLTSTKTSDRTENGETLSSIPRITTPKPPLFLSLRLFPDASVAHLTGRIPTTVTDPLPGEEMDFTSSQGRSRSRKQVIPVHRLPLDVFAQATDPWRSGASLRSTFTQAIINLEAILTRFAGRLPIVLVIPTRLLVTQKFCDDLFRLVVRFKTQCIISLALELPPGRILHESLPFDALQGPREREQLFWCRLPTLCTPWDTLIRMKHYSAVLRHQLGQHTLMPLHILFSWLVQERFWRDVETGLVVDTVAPSRGPVRICAEREGPDYFLSNDLEKFNSKESICDKAHGNATRTRVDRRLVSMNDDSSSRRTEAQGRHAVYAAATTAISQRQQDSVCRTPLSTFKQSRLSASSEEALFVTTDKGSRQNAWDPNYVAFPRAPEVATHRSGSKTPISSSLILENPPDAIKLLILNSIVTEDQKRPKYDITPSKCNVIHPATNLLVQAGQLVEKTYKMDREPSTKEACGSSIEKEAGTLHDFADQSSCTNNVESLLMQMDWQLQKDQQSTQPMGREENLAMCHPPGQRPHPVTDLYGKGYWRCLSQLRILLNHPSTVWTMPTFHQRQVCLWEKNAQMQGVLLPSSGEEGGAKDVQPFRPPERETFFIPVLLPLLSSVELEGQRWLREGPRSRPRIISDETENFADDDLSIFAVEGANTRVDPVSLTRWLPCLLESALTQTLAKLPACYRATSMAHVLSDYYRVQQHGRDPNSAREPESAIQTLATSTASENPLPERGGSEGDDKTSKTEVFPSTSDGMFRIRCRTERRPFWYQNPEHITKAQETAFCVVNNKMDTRHDTALNERLRPDGRVPHSFEENDTNLIDIKTIETRFRNFTTYNFLNRIKQSFWKGPDADVSKVMFDASPPSCPEFNQNTNKKVVQDTAPALGEFHRVGVISIAIPLPGLSMQDLSASWRALWE